MSNEMQRVKQAAAQTLAHYSGKDQFMHYNGASDAFIGYDGDGAKVDFSNEVGTKRSFGITLDSTGAVATHELILFPGIAPTAGKLVVTDGANGGGVTGFPPVAITTTPTLLKTLQEWIKFAPSRVIGAKLTSSNQLQHEETIDLYTVNPFRKATEPRTIRFSDHSNEHKNQLTITTINEVWQLDFKTEMRFRLLQATAANLTLYFGVRLDVADALKAKSAAGGAKN